MANQLNKVRVNAREKLEKEAEVVVEIQKPSALQTAAASHLSKKEEPHPLGSPKNLNEMKKVEITLNNPNDVKKIKKDVIDLTNKKRKVNITMKQMGKKLIIDGGDYDINREVADIRNFIGFKSAKVVESVEEETLDEAMDKKTAIEILKLKKKEDFFGRDGAKIYMSPDQRDALKKKVGRLGRDVPGPSKGVSTMIIINNALGKDGTDGNRGDYDTEGKKMINMRKGGKLIGTPRTIGDAMKLAGIREEVERKTFSQKVIESISEFGVESLLAEDNVDVLRSIVKRKSAKPIKFKDGTMTIDMQTANMMLTVLDKVKPDNQRKLAKMMNGKKSEFMKVHGFVMKALGK